MADCHGEKTTKHFDQCGSHDDKITDTITRFWTIYEMFWVSNCILQTCNIVLKFQQTVMTLALTV